MQKPRKIIAFDIDDVLAANAEGFAAFSNAQWGTSMTAADFSEDWMTMWGVSADEMRERSRIFHTSGIVASYQANAEALPVLKKLCIQSDLRVVTSRQQLIREQTKIWVENHFPGIFTDIHHSGIFDSGEAGAHITTKADMLRQIGASYLIDDQLKHCTAAAEQGVPAVLFGNYPWNQAEVLPRGVVRCVNWKEVEEYFDEQS